MAIVFREAGFPPIEDFTAAAPNGALIGVVGEDGAGKRVLLRLAAGVERPTFGEVHTDGTRRLLGPTDPLNLAPVDALLIEHTLGPHDMLVRARAAIGLERLRKSGAVILLVSHEEELLRWLADEVWWLVEGRLAAKGDPREVLDSYRRHIAEKLRAWGDSAAAPLSPSMRRGDGRAQLLLLQTLGEHDRPTMVWRSGEQVAVRVVARFLRPVADPVIGILIRTRIGFEVFGTNTELENVKLGPCEEGETLVVTFRFRCDLCPQEYTLTAASHDPDGVWHDWLEDALAFTVTDARYTAGVANLRARVEVQRGGGS